MAAPTLMPKLVRPRGIKKYYNYTVGDAARTLGVCKNTVRNWIKQGLPVLSERRPSLIVGDHLITFLNEKRNNKKQHLKPGEIYCVRCRAPVRPEEGIVFYTRKSPTLGSISGFCPECGFIVYRQVSNANLEAACGDLSAQEAQGKVRLIEPTKPSAICDKRK